MASETHQSKINRTLSPMASPDSITYLQTTIQNSEAQLHKYQTHLNDKAR